jgi:hypothetical protein
MRADTYLLFGVYAASPTDMRTARHIEPTACGLTAGGDHCGWVIANVCVRRALSKCEWQVHP